jgi:HTH-type transcriptional regulator/antitoxin MqsA
VYPKKCAECGGMVAVSCAPLYFDVRGESVTVPGVEHGECGACGEVYLTVDGAEVLQKEAIRRSKAAMGLLSPDEIRSLRRSLALSQAGFENLLGVGPKTVVRWEKGTVFQSATADRLMRLVRAVPEIAATLRSGELYGTSSACGSRAARGHFSRDWSASMIPSVQLRVVTNASNATAA